MAIAGEIDQKVQTGFIEVTDEGYKEANILASDAIMNHKVIQSFGSADVVTQAYSKYYEDSYGAAKRKAHISGFLYGMSQFVNNVTFCVAYYIGAYIIDKDIKDNVA